MRRALYVLLLGIALGARANEAAHMERAQRIVSGRCFLCHGMQGEASSDLSPRLAGQNAVYIATQLANFKSGERKSTAMRAMAANLTVEDMQALALYFSRQRVDPHPVTDAELAARGREIYRNGGKASEVPCAKCHGERAHGSDSLPRLAGQIPSYLLAQMRDFETRERGKPNAVLHSVAGRMTAEEMEAVAAYLSTLD